MFREVPTSGGPWTAICCSAVFSSERTLRLLGLRFQRSEKQRLSPHEENLSRNGTPVPCSVHAGLRTVWLGEFPMNSPTGEELTPLLEFAVFHDVNQVAPLVAFGELDSRESCLQVWL